jgi:hypothetical protein
VLVGLAFQFCLQSFVHVFLHFPVQLVLVAEAIELLLPGQLLAELEMGYILRRYAAFLSRNL